MNHGLILFLSIAAIFFGFCACWPANDVDPGRKQVTCAILTMFLGVCGLIWLGFDIVRYLANLW